MGPTSAQNRPNDVEHVVEAKANWDLQHLSANISRMLSPTSYGVLVKIWDCKGALSKDGNTIKHHEQPFICSNGFRKKTQPIQLDLWSL